MRIQARLLTKKFSNINSKIEMYKIVARKYHWRTAAWINCFLKNYYNGAVGMDNH